MRSAQQVCKGLVPERLASASVVLADLIPCPAWAACTMFARLTPSCLLCRALKTKHETPKYGLIYHASLIGQAPPKFKGKISRVLAAKCALSIRVDALGEAADAEVGLEARAKVRAAGPATVGADPCISGMAALFSRGEPLKSSCGLQTRSCRLGCAADGSFRCLLL